MSMPVTAPRSFSSTDVLALGGRRGSGYHSSYHGGYHHYGSSGSGGGADVWVWVLILIVVVVAILVWNAKRDQ
ncbi:MULTISPECIES: hypothetical protein [Streptomyces]|uniref:hypothetical protein n=1 Tax=Streptomyces TaxID=1883 RepID=UPI000B31B159|nr:hypothetical protein [Streptomyces durhamensis]